MRTRKEAIAACLQFPDAYEDYPFHDAASTAMRHKTNQKCFAFILEHEGKTLLCLKAEPQWGDFWKSAYAAVIPGYHLNKRHWISVILDGSMKDEEILPLIADSYQLTRKRVGARRQECEAIK